MYLLNRNLRQEDYVVRKLNDLNATHLLASNFLASTRPDFYLHSSRKFESAGMREQFTEFVTKVLLRAIHVF